MDMAPVTGFSSPLPPVVDLHPRSTTIAEEQPVNGLPCFHADCVNLALDVCSMFTSSYFITHSLNSLWLIVYKTQKELRECFTHTAVHL